ncbi:MULTISPECIES: GNAT family N-acetyltransferase [Streptomyces]|uniref:GCN5 family acetyltransferase n=2 Tax=Streptomyces TaxID=1883 RepID=A0A1Y2NZ37_STRFR|nr:MULTISPECIES: GNAT family protein [Streptomyces]AOT61703.1 Putative ribosomal N-acetyltransferase YdaF [Streptomyces rubrolavendulae]KAF0650499.1 GCN5 family acetyltransferase [Streptomyces fradiae ATCC 10745 = DSM 40063]OSY52803.1 putative ribosomal N-acetyltransferase YdaF [Streptomyces fradiae ATCC 10745 = DSM 40063]QEV14639.1 N-acetyltransferase [Streptomyces fradiae ATCC 10745 = DSM 40063]UQS29456.1 GNAT family N-acetyltransferase [Streptomyces fradiae]
MLTGDKIGLRARHAADLPVLRTELFNDVTYAARVETAPWRPIGPDSNDPRLVVDDTDEERVRFSVVESRGGTLIGSANLWGIDAHNRCAHIGLGLLPSARGKGYGTDVVAVLCHYAFVVRGLRRLQIETLSDNTAMLRAAERNGFVQEGLLRSSAWVLGEFLDEVVMGLLAQDWKPEPRG